MIYPSIKALTKAFGKHNALALRGIMIGSLSPRRFPETDEWAEMCFHPPSELELQMAALDEVLDGYGTEVIRAGECSDSDIVAEYINVGDAYGTTILYDHTRDKFLITSWGDWVEWAEKKKLIKED